MRLWKIDPRKMCDRHLLGEHVEMHMFVGCLRHRKSIQGYIARGLVEVHNIVRRHDRLVREMTRRGFAHASPLRCSRLYRDGHIDLAANIRDLARRCPRCRRLLHPPGRKRGKTSEKCGARHLRRPPSK
jgi:hypothetical protein